MSSGKSMSSSPKGSQNGSHSPLYSKNKQKNANPSENSEEIPIKSTSKRALEEGWWLRVEKEILKTLSHIGTEVNPVKNNATIRPIFVMGSFWFYEKMPNYQRDGHTQQSLQAERELPLASYERPSQCGHFQQRST